MKRLLPLPTMILAVIVLAVPRTAGATQQFSDVPQDAWYRTALDELADDGILAGYPDGTFGAADTLTLGQFTRMVCAAVLPTWVDTTNIDGNWATAYYFAAIDRNIYRETEFGQERLDAPISRYDAALILSRTIENVLQEDNQVREGIADEIADMRDIPQRYAHAVQLCYSAGLVAGFRNGAFCGERPLSRAEGLTLIYRLINTDKRINDSPTPSKPSTSDTPAVTPGESPTPKTTATPSASVQPNPSPDTSTASPFPSTSPDSVAFIGDSFTHGLYLYGKYNGPDYYYSTGMSIFRAANGAFSLNGNGGTCKLSDVLPNKSYTHIYIMLGINEIAAYVGDYADAYGLFLDKLAEWCPDAQIHIQSILPVSARKDASSDVYTIGRITKFNNALRELAHDRSVSFTDTYAEFADDDGFLPAGETWDGVHLNSKQYQRWVALVTPV